jgi:hypothetical protein
MTNAIKVLLQMTSGLHVLLVLLAFNPTVTDPLCHLVQNYAKNAVANASVFATCTEFRYVNGFL